MTTDPVREGSGTATPILRKTQVALGAVALAFLVLLWTASLVYLNKDHEQTLAAAVRADRNLVRAFSEHVNAILGAFDQTLTGLARDYARDPAGFAAAVETATHSSLKNVVFEAGFTGADGYVAASNFISPSTRVYAGDFEHFRVHAAADTGRMFVGKPIVGRTTGRLALRLTRRVNAPDGSFGGVVFLSVDPALLSQFYRSVDIGPTDMISVVGLDRVVRVRATGTGDDTVGQDLSASRIWSLLPSAPTGYYDNRASPIDGRRRIVSYETLADYPLVVAVGRDLAGILAEHNQRHFGLYASLSVITLLVFAATFWASRRIAMAERAVRLEEVNRILRENAAAARDLSQSKARFLANASHDLRQPLQALSLHVAALRRRVHGEAAEIAGSIEELCRSMERIFATLLDVARLDSGTVQPKQEVVCLSSLVTGLVPELAVQASESGVRLRLHVPELAVFGDTVMIETILRNLASNALKFTPRHGHVLVAARRRGERIALEVWDTGPGIAEADRERIFKEFERIEAAGNRRGLGLGLAIVARLCVLMGAEITVASRAGHGSRFRVLLPAAPSSACPRASAAAVPAEVAGLRLLLVDDDPQICDTLATLLGDAGCTVETAASGEAALRMAGPAPDVAILDLRLGPGSIDGIELAARLATRHAPPPAIVFLTGSTDPETLRRLAATEHPWLIKPADTAQLLEAIATAAQDRGAARREPVPSG